MTVTGHGSFKAKLQNANCKTEENAEHLLIDCREYEEEKILKELVKEKGCRFQNSSLLKDEEVARIAKTIGNKKEENIRICSL